VLQACHASIIKLQQIHFPAAALAGSPFVGKPAMLERPQQAPSLSCEDGRAQGPGVRSHSVIERHQVGAV